MSRFDDERSDSDAEMNGHQAQSSQMDGEFNEAEYTRRQLEQRKIRTQYRKLIADTEAHRKEFLDPMNNGLLENVDQANRLFKKAAGTTEATLDSKLLVMSADLGVQKSRHLRIGQAGFDETEYLTRLISRMGGHEMDDANSVPSPSSRGGTSRRSAAVGGADNDGDEADMEAGGLDWSRIGRIASHWTRRVPTMDFMLGPMSVEHKSRNVGTRQRIVRDPKQMRKPQELQEADIARQENETTKNVRQIARILEEAEGRVNLFELVINPESFGQTVENVFYLSFLVRDGHASITEVDADHPDSDLDDNDSNLEGRNIQPMVEACEEPTAQDYEAGLRKKQLVMDIDMATWRELIEVYNIRKPMIPTRPIREEHVAGKWYG